jgi:hypothetical protein
MQSILPLLLLAVPGYGYVSSQVPPLSPKSDDYARFFQVSLKDGHQGDSFVRRVQRLYNHIEGPGAIREGMRGQEKAILGQPGGNPDPAQSKLHSVTLQADAAVSDIYRFLREDALFVQEAWNTVRDAKAQTAQAEFLLNKDAEALAQALLQGQPFQPGDSGIGGALETLEESARLMEAGAERLGFTGAQMAALLPFIGEAAQWHADSHRAVGGFGNNPTEAALRDAATSANSATELGGKVFAVMEQIQRDTQEKILAGKETENLIKQAATLVNAALEDPTQYPEAEDAVVVAAAAAKKGAGAHAGCAACAAKAAARAFGSKREAAGLPELAEFQTEITLGEEALAITADGQSQVSSRGLKRLKLEMPSLGGL